MYPILLVTQNVRQRPCFHGENLFLNLKFRAKHTYRNLHKTFSIVIYFFFFFDLLKTGNSLGNEFLHNLNISIYLFILREMNNNENTNLFSIPKKMQGRLGTFFILELFLIQFEITKKHKKCMKIIQESRKCLKTTLLHSWYNFPCTNFDAYQGYRLQPNFSNIKPKRARNNIAPLLLENLVKSN